MKIVFIITLLTAMSVFAGHDTNGGDSCERRLLDIKEDIIDWVEKDGHKDLKYENALTAEEYKEVMLRRLSEANISCTTKILSVQGAEKTCVNSMKTKDIMHFLPDEYVKKNKRALKREKTGRIICNISRVSGDSADNQYMTIHHEYAGLSGLEVNSGDEKSDYFLSKQISAYLEDQTVKLLAVKKLNPNPERLGSLIVTFTDKFLNLYMQYNSVDSVTWSRLLIERCEEIDCVSFGKDVNGELLIYGAVHLLEAGAYNLGWKGEFSIELKAGEEKEIILGYIHSELYDGRVLYAVNLKVKENFKEIPERSFDDDEFIYKLRKRDHLKGSGAYYHEYDFTDDVGDRAVTTCRSFVAQPSIFPRQAQLCNKYLQFGEILGSELSDLLNVELVDSFTYRVNMPVAVKSFYNCLNDDKNSYSKTVKQYLKNNPGTFVSNYDPEDDEKYTTHCLISNIQRNEKINFITLIKGSGIRALYPGKYYFKAVNQYGGEMYREIDLELGKEYIFN